MAEEADTGAALGGRLDRARLEASLDSLVADNRFTIAVVFPLVGAVTMLAGAFEVVPREIAFDPFFVLFGVVIMRLPLVAGVLPLLDRRASGLLLGLCGYAYLIEYVGIRTGWPYGEFAYRIDLGPMIEGVPLGLPVFFLPLVLNAYLLAVLLLGAHSARRLVRLAATVALVLAIDLVLDPGAVAVGFWEYLDGGRYYGVPLSNYRGWILSGTVAVVAFDFAFDRRELLARLEATEFMLDDLVSFVLLWGLINLAVANWLAAGIAVLLGAGLLSTDRFDFSVLRSRFDPW